MKNTHTFKIDVTKMAGLIAIQCVKCKHNFNFINGEWYSTWSILTCDELIIKDIIE